MPLPMSRLSLIGYPVLTPSFRQRHPALEGDYGNGIGVWLNGQRYSSQVGTQFSDGSSDRSTPAIGAAKIREPRRQRVCLMASQHVCDDSSLMERIAQQDDTALSELYDRYARVLFSVAFKSLNSKEEAEEVVLDVFSQVWRIAERYDSCKGRVDSWLFMLTRSRVLDRLRAMQRANKMPTVSVDATQIQLPPSSVDPVEEALIAERRTHVLAALKTLPVEQRLVIELAYYKGLSQSEIAAQTGQSLGTVKTRVRLGLNKLRIALGAWNG
jgi:RNA polymerase sigma factor (sigma-70 family)